MDTVFVKDVIRRLALIVALILLAIACCAVAAGVFVRAEEQGDDGYDLWLRYDQIGNGEYLAAAQSAFADIVVPETDSQVIASAKAEALRGLEGMLGAAPAEQAEPAQNGTLIIGTKNDPLVLEAAGSAVAALPAEGYLLRSATYRGKSVTVVAGGDERGALYGTFRLLEMLQCREPVDALNETDAPKIEWRVLDQWDNWSGSIERGYAGKSIYQWDELPNTVDARYEDFARANASVGINTVVINNVNTQIDYIKSENLPKVAAVADVFRKWGIRLALTVRFDSPEKLGGLGTSDPFDSSVVAWWEDKFDEIYEYIPDFAGVLVKADSEGQSGPSEYGRTHADGANMFSDILASHNDAVVMWRAFVYGKVANSLSSDIVNQAYRFFKPLDGDFNDNVIVQSKNGPRDFLPIEPVAPLFGGMTDTNMGLEVQITQEYTGQSTHLCYLVPMWKYYLDTDLMPEGNGADTSQGTTLSRVVDGTVYDQTTTLIAGVANIGDDANWTRLELAQANWYGFGKLAWDPDASEDEITQNWIKMTFGQDEQVLDTLTQILETSWETYKAYTDPYGLGMTVDTSSHFSAALDYRNGNGTICVDEEGAGNDRTATGTGLNPDATEQYSEALGAIYADISTCPEELLFWFHHVPYDYVMSNGKTMLENVTQGVTDAKNTVLEYKMMFDSLQGKIDEARFSRISKSFISQLSEAAKWEQEMLSFFSEWSGESFVSEGVNLAEGRPAYASQTRKDWTADKAVDGVKYTDGSRWATEQTDENHWIYVDLGKVMTVNRVELYWENFSMRYVIETATQLSNSSGGTDSDWTPVAYGRGNEWAQNMSGKNDTSVLFCDTQARYVRMRTLEKNSSLWNSLYEIEIYGDDLVQTAKAMLETELYSAAAFTLSDGDAYGMQYLKDRMNAAQLLLDRGCTDGKLLVQAYNDLKDAFNEMTYEDLARGVKARRTTVNGTNHTGNAVDGDPSTCWRPLDSDGAPSMTIDFGKERSFSRIEIDWKVAPASYTVEGRNADSNSWTLIQNVDRSSQSASDVLETGACSFRFLRISILEREAVETSLYRFSVYDTTSCSDKDGLAEKIAQCEAADKDGYVGVSSSALSQALQAANGVLGDDAATARDAESVTRYLEKTFASMLVRGDKTRLAAAVEEASALSANEYAEDSFAALSAALDTAKGALQNEDAMQWEIDSVENALRAAQSALVRLADKTQLTAAYDEWKDFSADAYTQESADAFRSALQNAKAVLDDADATQEEIDAALAALQAAHGALAPSDTAEKTQGGCSGSAAGASLLCAAMLIVPAAILSRRKNKRNIQ